MTANYATEAQIKTISGLLERKAWNDDKEQPAKYISRAAVVKIVIAFATGELEAPKLERALDAEEVGQRINQLMAVLIDDADPTARFAWAQLTRKGASNMITWLTGIRDAKYVDEAAKVGGVTGATNRPAPAELEDGIYRNPAGQYVKVYKTQKGYQVAKVANIVSVPGNEGAGSDTWEVTWNYVGKAGLGPLKPSMKLSLEEARDFGHIYGSCCICSRELTDELSIALGIGPICGKREFGGEFTTIMKAKKEELKG